LSADKLRHRLRGAASRVGKLGYHALTMRELTTGLLVFEGLKLPTDRQPVGVKEIEMLIEKLPLAREILADADEDREPDSDGMRAAP
jgi:hypothetical protein